MKDWKGTIIVNDFDPTLDLPVKVWYESKKPISWKGQIRSRLFSEWALKYFTTEELRALDTSIGKILIDHPGDPVEFTGTGMPAGDLKEDMSLSLNRGGNEKNSDRKP